MRKAVSAILLAGGRSRRMGRDKRFVRVGGKTLLARAAETLLSVSDDVVVSIRAGERAILGGLPVRWLPDERPFHGPLRALAGAIRAVRRERAVVLPCDMIRVRPAFLRFLAAEARRRRLDALCLEAKGRLHPFPGVYRKTCAAEIRRMVRRGESRVTGLLESRRLRVGRIGVRTLARFGGAARLLSNWNRPRDTKK